MCNCSSKALLILSGVLVLARSSGWRWWQWRWCWCWCTYNFLYMQYRWRYHLELDIWKSFSYQPPDGLLSVLSTDFPTAHLKPILIYKWGQFLHVWDWESHIKGQYFGVTWPSLKGSGGSKAIPCVIHQTAKTHTLNETCCNWWVYAVFVAGFVMLLLFLHVVALYVAYGFLQQ